MTSPPRRARTAERLRRLAHAFMSYELPTDLLDEITTAVDALLPRIEACPHRVTRHPDQRTFEAALAAGDVAELIDRAYTPLFGHTMISGPANPMGVDAAFRREGDTVVAEVVLGRAYEGAPGRAHGGILSAILDETMGAAALLSGDLAFTGQLTVTYRAPTPIETPLEFRAWITGREDRKIFVHGEGRHEDRLLTEAEGVFVVPAEPPWTATG
ncbi:MAG TPA: PaaI family thioesterase [Actinobacteria bacterium]|nr:PaaI family thioesterase [Actinomycetota bacterium]